MSEVTNLIITTSLSENATDVINKMKSFYVNKDEFRIVSVEDDNLPPCWYGGSKYLECNIFIGAYNYLDGAALLAFMRNEMKWEDPESIQIIIQEQFDTKFKIIDLFPYSDSTL